MQTIFKEYNGNFWEYWMNAIGKRVFLSERNFLMMEAQGAKIINLT